MPLRPYAKFTLRVGTDIDMTPFRASPLPRGSRELNAQLRDLFESAALAQDPRQ